MKLQYVITGGNGDAQIILVIDGESHVLPSTHDSFAPVIEAIRTGDEEKIPRLVRGGAEDVLSEVVGDDVEIVNGVIHYKGTPMYGTLADDILRYHRSGQPTEGILAFLENLNANPSRNSREQLYEFLSRHDFEITPEGKFRAYKGVRADFRSVTAGPGYVNGVYKENAHLDNSPGNTLHMPREDVQDNVTIGCGPGLHVGTYTYAASFSPQGRVVLVEVNPRDVVSVPNDADWQKVRTSFYFVVEEVTDKPTYGYGESSPYWTDYVYEEEDDWDSYVYEEVDDWEDDDWEEDEEDNGSTVEDFLFYLEDVVEPYSYKGRVAASYTELAYRFEFEPSPSIVAYARELDQNHPSASVYAYHIRGLLSKGGMK